MKNPHRTNRSSCTSHKLVKMAALTLLLGATSMPPAMASTLPLSRNNPIFARMFSQFQQYFSNLQTYVEQVLSETLAPLGEDVQAAIDDAIGSLGLPDPIEARTGVEDALQDRDTLIHGAERAANEADRQITRAAISAELGEEGQQSTQEDLKATRQSVQSVQAEADTAEGEVVTQNVIKRIAQQNAQQAALLGTLRQEAIQSRQDAALTNLNLTNISRTVDGQNRAQQMEKVSEGMNTLKAASQATLF